MLNRRVQILFDKDSWNKLVKVAKSDKISAGEFIRQAVKLELEKKDLIDQNKRIPFKGLFNRGSKPKQAAKETHNKS